MVGGNTAVSDNPSLTDRSGLDRRRKLVRVVLDNRLRIPLDSTLVKTASDTPTFVVSNSDDQAKVRELVTAGVDIAHADARDLCAVLREIYDRSLQSVLVEGGSEIAGAFVDARLVDKVTLIAAPLIIGGHQAPVAIGGKGAQSLAEALKLSDIEVTRFENDFEFTGYPEQ